MYLLLLFTLLIVICSASFYGPCPRKQPVSNFNLTAYATGVWYEVARSHNNLEKKADCVTTNITQKDHGVLLEVHEVVDSILILSDVIGFQNTEEADLGKMIYIVHGFELNVTILGVDYNKFSVEYNCVYDEEDDIATELLWVISRTKTVDKETMKEIEKIIKSAGLSDAELFWDHHTDESCSYTSLKIDRPFQREY